MLPFDLAILGCKVPFFGMAMAVDNCIWDLNPLNIQDMLCLGVESLGCRSLRCR
jgi:hypothetical protein